MIPKKTLEEYEKSGEDISDEQALEEATNLITLVKAIYRPIKKEWLDELERKDKEKSSQ
jgi:hypothetical protein